jgi:glycosyltransferase involved in cell wall biosynthesis
VPPATVLYVHSSSEHYGADRQLALIAGGLDRSRFTPLVVVPEPGPLVDDLRTAGVEVLIRPLAVVRRGFATPVGAVTIGAGVARDGLALRSLIKQRDVKLVHSNTSVVLGGAVAAKAARIPHVWHVREIYAAYGRAWTVHRRVLQAGATALPCVSAATTEQFGGVGAGGGKVSVLYDALAVARERAPRAAARAALELPEDVPVVALLARLTEWKGQDVLIRALAEPELRDRRAVAVLAGAVWPGQEAREAKIVDLARSLGIEDRVVRIGFREDVENVYGAADVIAVPSTLPDPLPGAAIEAAAAGCAVIAAAHGGLPEIISDRETGLLVPPGHVPALARAAAELIDDPALRERLGAAASLDIAKRFSAEALLSSVQHLYERQLDSHTATV